jgi:murein DD-endopeptidase MepM/ murein hydrolase activator NlpD
MPSLRRPLDRVVLAGLAALIGIVTLAVELSPGGVAHAASVGQLQQQISQGQGAISNLSGAVSAASGHLGQLHASVATLEGQIASIQADLDAKRAQLLKLRTELIAARTRLAQLQAFEAHAQSVLSQELISTYEADRPDLVTVVVEARGFTDLLERINFAQRIQKQDVQIVGQVRTARRAVAAQATNLGGLERRQQTITTQVLAQRNNLARTRLTLVQQELGVQQVRDSKAGQLASARAQVASLQGQLNQIQAAQAAAAAAQAPGAAGSGSSASVGSGAVSSGGGFTFPLPKGSASPPSTWSEDQGVDISAPGGTPELAVCSGTIVLHGIGGFGPDAPVLHCDSSLGGYSYVYYGHAGPANQLAVGTHVGAGQVMSEVGPGIVGISTGPHLEIGFCDGSGTPVGGGSASTMMSLLQGSYGG